MRERLEASSADQRPTESADEITALLERGVEARLASTHAPSLVAVINATGVVVHTNLGRAPLARWPRRASPSSRPATPTSSTDLATGTRGRRDSHAERLLCRLTGAEAAVVVNNNAAAALISLAALAAGREVVISRGELVEIGGGFRVPDVMAQSGAILREVGTTNRTRVSDYAAAISDRTAAHPARAPLELHDRRFYRTSRRRRARGARPPIQHSRGRRPGQWVPRLPHRRGGARQRALGRGQPVGRREPRDVQRRQAPRRPAGGSRRRLECGRWSRPPAPADASAQSRQDDVRGARGHARGTRGRTRRRLRFLSSA